MPNGDTIPGKYKELKNGKKAKSLDMLALDKGIHIVTPNTCVAVISMIRLFWEESASNDDINKVKKIVIENKTGFYDACAKGLFCTLGKGEVDFEGVRDTLINNGFSGWCTVEQDCDPQGDNSPINDAKLNRDYLMKIGF